MLEILDSPETVFAVEAVGKLEKDDYDTVLGPAVRKMAEEKGEIRAVFVMGTDSAG